MSGIDSGWQIIEDPSMAPGGCRVHCGSSVVDASLERRLADVLETTAEATAALRSRPLHSIETSPLDKVNDMR